MLHVVSQVSDGNMAFQHGEKSGVIQNRQQFLARFDIDLNKTVICQNQHSDNVFIADQNSAGLGMTELESAPPADALITTDKDLALSILTADCIPLVLVDRVESVLALAHVSWKTADLGLPAKVVESLSDNFAVIPNQLTAHFGPSIQAESYVLDLPIEQENKATWKDFLQPLPQGKVKIDLAGFTRAQLLAVGLSPENIELSPIDTATNLNYFSHYRSQRTGEAEGRFVTIASL